MQALSPSAFDLIAQAATRLRELGLPTPWELTPPFPPLLATLTGLPADQAVWTAILLGWAAGAAAAYGLVRRRLGTAVAWQAGGLALLAPSRILAVWRTDEPALVLFWGFFAVALWALTAKPGWGSVAVGLIAVLAAVGSRPCSLSWVDLIAAGELALFTTFFRPIPVRGVALALFMGVGLWSVSADAEPLRRVKGRTLESLALESRLDSRRRAGVELIRSSEQVPETLLWLRALAVSSVAAPCDGKLSGQLESGKSGNRDCRFAITQNSAEAVIVSRSEFDRLRPIRGPLDVERLERYVTWAGRPESVTVHRPAPGRLELNADLGPNAAILLRRDFSEQWRASGGVELREDPLGYTVLLAPDPGEVKMTLDSAAGLVSLLWPPPLDDRPVDAGEFPIIHAEGVVDGSSFSGPPFAAGATLSIFGQRFASQGNAVGVGDAATKILYESATQINVRLPTDLSAGKHALAVTSDGRTTEPYPIEVAP